MDFLLQVKTDNGRLAASQNAIANYIVQPFNAEGGPLIMVRQLSEGKVMYELHNISKISWMCAWKINE